VVSHLDHTSQLSGRAGVQQQRDLCEHGHCIGALLSMRCQLDRACWSGQRLLRYLSELQASHIQLASTISLAHTVPVCSNNCTSPANGVCTAADSGVPHCQCKEGWALGLNLDCSLGMLALSLSYAR
jgi:hypothetical protein